MSTPIHRICDRCGKDEEGLAKRNGWAVCKLDVTETYFWNGDVCPDCRKAIIAFFKNKAGSDET